MQVRTVYIIVSQASLNLGKRQITFVVQLVFENDGVDFANKTAHTVNNRALKIYRFNINDIRD